MPWTVEQVLSLAPDAASATAGRGLANGSKWASSGQNADLAWGEAKGSGAKPYQTVASLSDGASKCSCPSRKFPCKHAIGLLLFLAQGEVSPGDPPAWATEWQEKRGAKAAAPPKAPAAADPKTAEKRWATVLKGLDECEAFLHDAVRDGLLSMSSARTWDEMAKRMVDAQAPGVARRLRSIGGRIGVGPDWTTQVAEELGSLGLLLEAARRTETLGDLAYDVKAALGIPNRKEDAEETVADTWDALGSFAEEVDRLWNRRTWFKGRSSGRWVLHLAFAPHGSAPPSPHLPFGAALTGEAHFFPSAWPLRASLDDGKSAEFRPSRGGTWADAFEDQANALAQNPWIDAFPVLLTDAAFARNEDAWFVVDARGEGMPLANSDADRERILGRTGNVRCEMFGEFDGQEFRLLSYWAVNE